MTKCQPRLLTPYVDDELSPDLRDQVEEHLRGCPSCGALLEEVTVASGRVREMGRAAIPATALEPALQIFAARAGLIDGAPSRSTALAVALSSPEPAGSALAPSGQWQAAGDGPPPPAESRAGGEGPGEPADEAQTESADTPAEPEATARETPPIDDDDVTLPEEYLRYVRPQPEELPSFEIPEAAPADEAPAEEVPSDEAPSEAAEAPSDAATAEPEEAKPEPGEEDAVPTSGGPGIEASDGPPLEELRPPWLSPSKVDDADLEADGRRAVDEAMEHPEEQGAAEEGPTEQSSAPDAPEAPVTPEAGIEEAPPSAEESDAPPQEETSAPTRPLDPALEPPPEPWDTVWRQEPEEHAPGGDQQPPPQQEPEGEAPAALTPEPTGHPEGGSTTPEPPLPEVEEAVARLRSDLYGAEPAPPEEEAAAPEVGEEDLAAALEEHRRVSLPRLALPDMSNPSTQIAVALGALIVLIGIASLLTLPGLLRKAPAPTTATHSQPPVVTASAAPSHAPSSAPTAPAVAPNPPAPRQLAEVLTAGSGGSGYKVLGIRTGGPSAGVFRLVLDLDGGGPPPTAQIGRGTDGADYLSSSGITIDPAVLQGFSGGGPVTGISQVSPNGLDLRVATSSSTQYWIGYLYERTRLVIDFK